MTTSRDATITAGNGRDPAAVDAELRTLPPAEAAARQAAMRREFAEEPLPDCPPLPAGARLDPALGAGAGQWIDNYADYGHKVSPMTPIIFHVGAALWLASVAIARRLRLALAFGDVYPNLFVAWIAPTTLWRKTTGLDIARKIAHDLFPHLLATQDTTPEGLLSDLAGREPAQFTTDTDRLAWLEERNYAAQRGLVLDELSGLMAGAGKDYNAGMVEALLRFYDCDPLYTRSTRGQGRLVVHNSYLALLGASTPAAMAPHLANDRLWAMGWWPRFAILTPEDDRPTWTMPQEPGEPPTKGLEGLYTRLPQVTWPDAPKARTANLGAGVDEAWQRYTKAVSYDLLTPDLDQQLWGSYGRLPVQAMKVALILAALDWPEDGSEVPTIGMAHLARAIAIVETWRASVHRVVSTALASEFDRLARRVLRQVSRHDPDGATLREIYRTIPERTPREVQDVIDEMVSVGMVEAIKVASGTKGGRPTFRYRVQRG